MEQVNQQQQGDQTYYRKFACLFKSELYQDRHKNWMVKFRFDNNVMRFSTISTRESAVSTSMPSTNAAAHRASSYISSWTAGL